MTRKKIYLRTLITSIFASLITPCFAWTIASRELVDVQFLGDDSLIILVSSPNAREPGIYRWQRDADSPTLLCSLAAPAAFSFDRKTIIERVGGAASELRLYAPSNCHLLGRIKIEGRVIDADVRGALVAVAVRLPDAANELRIYGQPVMSEKSSKVLARSDIGRNVEMGVAPDGRSIVNFDLSDGGAAGWRLPSLASLPLPTWMAAGETTFVPGSRFVKRYLNDTLTVARWPSGASVYSMVAARTVRLRQLSATGRHGALHSGDPRVADDQSLDWVDFATHKRVRLATGSVDNAAINSAGNRVVWALRSTESTDLVSVQFARINADGDAAVISEVK